MSPWMGLRRAAPASCAWMDDGFDAEKKPGLASFCRPAKQNVKPKKARKGSTAHPVSCRAWAGGASHDHWSRPGIHGARAE